MVKIEDETVLMRSDIPGSQIDDEMVFFNHDTGLYYGTGSVGAAIWTALSDPRSFQEICSHLLSIYDVEPETCEKQVRRFLSEMHEAGIVKVED